MKSNTRRRSELVVVAVAALSLGAVAVRATSPASPVEQAKPTIAVGVVDVNRILDALAEREVVMSRLMAEHTGRVKQLEDIAAQIKSTESRLGSLHEDAVTDRQKLAGQLVELQSQYRAKKEVVERLADLDLGREMWPLYLKINDAVGRVGRASGFDVVISDDSPLLKPERKQLTGSDVSKISSERQIFYATGDGNITEAVITLMNNEFSSAGATGGRGR